MNTNVEVPFLTKQAESDIREQAGISDLVFILAFDAETGKFVPLAGNNVASAVNSKYLDEEHPILTEKIVDLQSLSLVSYSGSRCCTIRSSAGLTTICRGG